MFQGPLLEVISTGDVTVVRFKEGEELIGEMHVPVFQKEVTAIIAEHHPKTIQFDLSGVELFASAVLGVFASIQKSGVEVTLNNRGEDLRDLP